MGILCSLGRHSVVDRGVRNCRREFGRCGRCGRDMMRDGASWKPVPKGYRVVWRPKTGNAVADQTAGQAAVGRQVDLKGVTVVGERVYGAQRFALVILNQRDSRDYSGGADRIGSHGGVADQMERQLAGALLKPAPAKSVTRSVTQMVGQDDFDWDGFDSRQRAAGEAAARILALE